MDNSGPTARESVADVHERIVDMVFEIEDIRLRQNYRIEAEYAVKVGYLENDLLKWQIVACKSRRRLALAREYVETGLSFDESEFTAAINREMENLTDLLEQKIESFLQAIEHHTRVAILSASDARALRHYYRRLVGRLHFDLNPRQSPVEARLYDVAEMAYEQSDLDVLRSVAFAAEALDKRGDGARESDDESTIEREFVLAHERVLAQKLAEVKSGYPYALKAKLDNPAWVAHRVATLLDLIEEQKDIARDYDDRFAELWRKNRIDKPAV